MRSPQFISARDWATFSYDEIYVSTNFHDGFGNPLIVYGPHNRYVPVPTHLGLPDNTIYRFDYTIWGQVYQIRRLAPDGHQLAKTFYDLPGDTVTPQTDCPRFTDKRQSAEYWIAGESITTCGLYIRSAFLKKLKACGEADRCDSSGMTRRRRPT